MPRGKRPLQPILSTTSFANEQKAEVAVKHLVQGDSLAPQQEDDQGAYAFSFGLEGQSLIDSARSSGEASQLTTESNMLIVLPQGSNRAHVFSQTRTGNEINYDYVGATSVSTEFTGSVTLRRYEPLGATLKVTEYTSEEKESIRATIALVSNLGSINSWEGDNVMDTSVPGHGSNADDPRSFTNDGSYEVHRPVVHVPIKSAARIWKTLHGEKTEDWDGDVDGDVDIAAASTHSDVPNTLLFTTGSHTAGTPDAITTMTPSDNMFLATMPEEDVEVEISFGVFIPDPAPAALALMEAKLDIFVSQKGGVNGQATHSFYLRTTTANDDSTSYVALESTRVRLREKLSQVATGDDVNAPIIGFALSFPNAGTMPTVATVGLDRENTRCIRWRRLNRYMQRDAAVFMSKAPDSSTQKWSIDVPFKYQFEMTQNLQAVIGNIAGSVPAHLSAKYLAASEMNARHAVPAGPMARRIGFSLLGDALKVVKSLPRKAIRTGTSFIKQGADQVADSALSTLGFSNYGETDPPDRASDDNIHIISFAPGEIDRKWYHPDPEQKDEDYFPGRVVLDSSMLVVGRRIAIDNGIHKLDKPRQMLAAKAMPAMSPAPPAGSRIAVDRFVVEDHVITSALRASKTISFAKHRPPEGSGWLSHAPGIDLSTGSVVTGTWNYHPPSDVEELSSDVRNFRKQLTLMGTKVFLEIRLDISDDANGRNHGLYDIVEPQAGFAAPFKLVNALWKATPKDFTLPNGTKLWQELEGGSMLSFTSPGILKKGDTSHSAALVNLLWNGDPNVAVSGTNSLVPDRRGRSGFWRLPTPVGLTSLKIQENKDYKIVALPGVASSAKPPAHVKYYEDFYALFALTHAGQGLLSLPQRPGQRRPRSKKPESKAEAATPVKKADKVPAAKSGKPAGKPATTKARSHVAKASNQALKVAAKATNVLHGPSGHKSHVGQIDAMIKDLKAAISSLETARSHLTS